MQTINELSAELKLTKAQADRIQVYISQLVIELLESIRDDNNRNFDETINNLKGDPQ